MNRWQLGKRIYAGGHTFTIGILILVISFSVLQSSLLPIVSAAETGTWATGNMPQLNVGALTSGVSSPTCYPNSFTYQSFTNSDGSWSTAPRDITQSGCASALNSNLYSSAGADSSTSFDFIAPGTSYAFRITDLSGRPSSVMAIPYHPAYILTGSDGNYCGGRYLRFIDSLPAVGTFEKSYVSVSGSGSAYEMAYKFSSLPSPLRDGANNLMYMMNAYAYSSSGTWMLAEINNLGIVRINTMTRQMTLIDASYKPAYCQGWTPMTSLAISDDGNTALMGGNSADTVAFDLSGCQQVSFVIGANNTTPGCVHRSLTASLSTQQPGYSGLYDIRFSGDDKSVSGKVRAYNVQTGTYMFKSMTLAVAGYQTPPATYMALGDSFSSGEGAGEYEGGTDNADPRNRCHLSQNSYPYLVAQQLGISSFHSVACSGAKYQDYLSSQDKQTFITGNPLGEWLPGYATNGQRGYLKRAVNANVLTISMIGNDIGFNDKIKRCILVNDACYHFKEDRQAVANEIYSKFDTLVGLYKSLQNDAPGARIYVVGYPQLFSGISSCSGYSNANVTIEPEERAFSRGLVTYLNAVVKAATEKAGVKYIDVENALAGHQLCDPGGKAVNGLTAGNSMAVAQLNDLPPIGAESFHPNQLGHQYMKDALLAQTQDLTAIMPLKNDSKTAPYIGSNSYNALIGTAPSGGSSVIKRTAYVGAKYADIVYKDATATLPSTLDGITEALQPSSVFQVWFNSVPTYAGTLATDSSGVLSGNITVPSGLAPGYHTLHLYGKNVSNQDVDMYKLVYVAESQTDIDGDGVSNDQESCLATQPVGRDYDQDGTDDACDPEITDVTAPDITLLDITDGSVIDLSTASAPACTATDTDINSVPVGVPCAITYSTPAVYGETTTVQYAATATDASQNTKTVTGSFTAINPKSVTPLLSCVEHGPTDYTAQFGYHNPNWVTVMVPLGANNAFSPLPQDRGQTVTFSQGAHANQFTVPFASGEHTWNLTGNTATATIDSIACTN